MKTMKLIAILAALATPAAAHGAGFELAEQSASAGGTGAAGTARDADASAAWYDPAALADGGGLRVGLGLLAARPSLTAKAMDGSWTASNQAAWATPPSLSLSFAHHDWAAGVWAGVPFGSGVTWPADWPGRHEITRSQITVFRVAPFVAWRFGSLRVGGGVHVDAGRLEVARKLDFIDVDGDVAIDMDGVGVGAELSLFWQARGDLDVGLTYKSRTVLHLSGGANFTTPDAFSEKTADQNAKSTMTMPDRFVLGARWRRGAFAALADVELALWSVNDQLVIDFANPQTPDVVQENGWNSTLAVRGGGEWTRKQLTVRAGAYYDPSPAPNDTLAPSSPDSSRVGVTVGLGWRFDHAWRADAFYEHMSLLGRSSSGGEALAATYGGSADMLGFGVSFQR
jgi:long-chain fatty acid transport protein